jgi:hypothetical protein
MKKEAMSKDAQGAVRLSGETQAEGMAESAAARQVHEAMRSVTEAMQASNEAMRPVAEAMAAAESATARAGGGEGDATPVYEIDATLFDITAGDRSQVAG